MLTAAANALSTTSSAATTNICNARYLGKSDLLVSESCLGTMTFGIQNNDDDAFQQLDYATSTGCNFIDTAELYPVPLTSPEYRAGATEEILGRYIAKDRVCREDLVIATKICGYSPNSRVAAARSYPNEPISPPPDCRLDSSSVKNAVDASLRRLNTDYIDLYQIHWPDRYVPSFGMTTFQHTQAQQREDDEISILETASALKDMIDEGKIRYIGLSNESTFGVCQWINACEQLGIRDKLATIQNSYNLLDRRFDSELAEACHHYDIGLLPWSVLAGGLLSGKYNKRHDGSNVITSGMLKAQMPFGLPIMRMDDSPELNEGELLRWCAEAVMFPLALVWMTKSGEENSTLKWHSSDVDENAATLEFNHNGTNVRLNFNFDSQTHLVTSMHCMRPRMVGTLTERARWEGYCYDYERRGGMIVPTRMECGWKLDNQKEVELYFKGKNESFIYLMS